MIGLCICVALCAAVGIPWSIYLQYRRTHG